MASLTIRNLDDDLKRRLRLRAAQHGHSMEEEARRILRNAVRPSEPVPGNIADAIAAITDPFGGVELDIPPREPYRPDPSLDWFMDESIELPDPKPKPQS
jgi:plasmid stability protein